MRNLTKGFALECPLPRQHFKQNCAHGKEIRSRINRFVAELFGGRIPRCAEKDSWQCCVRKSCCGFFLRAQRDMLRNSEVSSFDPPFASTMLLGFRSRWTIPIL